MRGEIFLLGILMLIIGPIITAIAFSSCLGTILSGNVFGCVTDVGYLIIGGTFFVVGIVTAFIGLIMPDALPRSPSGYGYQPVTLGPAITCRKCGRDYNSNLLFCPACGQRPG